MACHRGADQILDEGGVGGPAGKSLQPRQCSCRERIHDHLADTGIYARLNTKATDRALETQADRLCSLATAIEVMPALTHNLLPQ
jgi:hypothetical protein